MARLPEELIERIKREVALEDLCRGYGIELLGSGKNRLGKCPFHEDGEPSFAVTPSKNLWNCLAGCGGGDPIELVMRFEKLSFRHAAEKLAQKIGAAVETQTVTGISQTHELLIDPESVNEGQLLEVVTDFYHQTFLNQPQAMKYLQERSCFHPEAVKAFRIGYANRTLGYRVPATIQKGKDLKAKLQKIGIVRGSGHEHLSGSVVFPLLDADGKVVQLYGRKVVERLRKGTPKHLYLEGSKRGIWNREGILQQKEWIVCESILDALTVWCHGFRNVTCAFGVNGFTPDLWKLVEQEKPERIIIAYDNDKAGNTAAELLTKQLAEKGIGVRRAQLPEGYDVNKLAKESQSPSSALAAVIEESRCTVAVAAPQKSPQKSEKQQKLESSQDQNNGCNVTLPRASLNLAASLAADAGEAKNKKVTGLVLVWKEDDIHTEIEGRSYRIRGMKKNLAYSVLKVSLRIVTGDRFHLDTLDLCHFKQREGFLRVATEETKQRPEVLKKDLGLLLMALEEEQEKIIKATLEPEEKVVEISNEERDEALTLLKAPNLIERITEDLGTCGLVGEETNKVLGYLATVSRKFDKPLGVIIQSTSAAGKTTLMEAILAMIPAEEQIKYSALTGQALFYLGETNLQHKILAIAEEEGAERATYALKLLQSEGELTIASTGKDATTGRMETQEYHVEGPAMIFFTTTSIEIDEELQNRCLTLTVDESREQTQRIHALQREARTLQGLEKKNRRKELRTVHQNAQRLLQSLDVINPYASKLTFPSENTRLRRDQEKYLTLIDTIALLHQYQRPSKERNGRKYIEATLEDIAAANRLAAECFGRCLDEMPPQTRGFLDLLFRYVKERSKEKDLEPNQVRFTQRDAREATGWSQPQVKRHLARLAELEYLIIHSGGRGSLWKYELVYHGEGKDGSPFLMGLIDESKLQDDAKWNGQNAEWNPSGTPQAPPRDGGGSPPEKSSKSSKQKASRAYALKKSQNEQLEPKKNHASQAS